MSDMIRLLKYLARKELQYDALELDGEIKLARHCLELLNEDWSEDNTDG